MTPERELQIRANLNDGQSARPTPCDDWRCDRCAAVQLLAELDRLRAAADSFRSYLDLLGDRHNELADRSESALLRDAYIAIAGAIAGIEAQGRTLGLFKDNP